MVDLVVAAEEAEEEETITETNMVEVAVVGVEVVGGGSDGYNYNRSEGSTSNTTTEPNTAASATNVNGSPHSETFDINAPRKGGNNGGSHSDLVELLHRLDGKQYPGYHDIESSTKGWINDTEGYSLYIARTQSDPFARPTRCRVVVTSEMAKFPPVSYQNKVRSVALGDYLNRVFYECCNSMGADVGAGDRGWGGSKGGDIEVRRAYQILPTPRQWRELNQFLDS